MLRPVVATLALSGLLAGSSSALAAGISPVAFERLWQSVVEDARPLVRPRSVSAVTGIVRGATVYRRPVAGGQAEAIAENDGPRRVRIELPARGFVAELEEDGNRCSMHVEARAGLPIFSPDELRADPAVRQLQRLLGGHGPRGRRGRR